MLKKKIVGLIIAHILKTQSMESVIFGSRNFILKSDIKKDLNILNI